MVSADSVCGGFSDTFLHCLASKLLILSGVSTTTSMGLTVDDHLSALPSAAYNMAKVWISGIFD